MKKKNELPMEVLAIAHFGENNNKPKPRKSRRALRITLLASLFVFGIFLTIMKAPPDSTWGFIFQTTKADGSTKIDRIKLEAKADTVNAYFLATDINSYADDANAVSKLQNSPKYLLTASGWDGATSALFRNMKIYNAAISDGDGDWSDAQNYEFRIDDNGGTNLLTLTSAGVLKLKTGNALISNVQNPVADQDAATKKYVDDCVSAGNCTAGGSAGWLHNTTGQHLIYPHGTSDYVLVGTQAEIGGGGYYLQLAGDRSLFAQGNVTIAPSSAGVISTTIKGTSGGGGADIFQVQSSGGTNYLKISSAGDATIGDSTSRNQTINGTLTVESPNARLVVQ